MMRKSYTILSAILTVSVMTLRPSVTTAMQSGICQVLLAQSNSHIKVAGIYVDGGRRHPIKVWVSSTPGEVMRMVAYTEDDNSTEDNWIFIDRPAEIRPTERHIDGINGKDYNWKATFSVDGKKTTVYFNLSRLS